ncbi:MAG: alpha/beta fold hydrolase [Gammaproteobacteria bacterium]|nr:alpha/beta fold hydrolase [Gammaproteobacteria bacterium]MBT8133653.1 alpha/beta fold hydrolase [Gammaproteobacteria bacterium]NNJ50726.1 alpha/beta fold hydrolase [Gammaproteobacteria bacterium]
MKSKTIKCQFDNSRGLTLEARLDLPSDHEENSSITFIIYCHCFTCNKDTITSHRLSRMLAERGFAVLRFDFSGLGGSEGEFATTTFHSMRDDLKSAIEFLKQNYQAPCYIVGHSFGGTTALAVAQSSESIEGVITLASPFEPAHVLHHLDDSSISLLDNDMPSSFEVAGQLFGIDPEFVHDVRAFNMKAVLRKLTKPVLILNIEDDTVVGEENARQIQHWHSGESVLLDIADSDHMLSDRKSSEEAADLISDWISKKSG